MKKFKLRLEFNRGRHGIPLGKLANIGGDFLAFLNSFASDLGVKAEKSDWYASNFQNGSLFYDVELQTECAPHEIEQMQSIFKDIVTPQNLAQPALMRISDTTQSKFAKAFAHLDADEFAFIGLIQDDAIAPEMRAIRQAPKPNLVDGLIDRQEYGEIQGVVHSFVKGAEPPYLEIRELSTNELVKCYFKRGQYKAAVELLTESDAVVFVEGWLRLHPDTQFVKRIEVEDFRPAPDFLIDKHRAALGSMPDFEVDTAIRIWH